MNYNLFGVRPSEAQMASDRHARLLKEETRKIGVSLHTPKGIEEQTRLEKLQDLLSENINQIRKVVNV